MINILDRKIVSKFLPFLIFLFAFTLRVYGINWDQNQHLHPDERFLTMTVNSMSLPDSFFEYLNPEVSKLNPYNIGVNFFVYGTFPTSLVKYFSKFELFDIFQYNNIALTGRLISAILDAGVVIFIFFIAKNIFGKKSALASSLLYSVFVLPIQLSHFFAVDTFLNFFLVLSFYLLVKFISKRNTTYAVLTGLAYGTALGCKISAIYFLPVIFAGFLTVLLKYKSYRILFFSFCAFLFGTFVSLRISDPRIFSGYSLLPVINPQFIQNISDLRSQGVQGSIFPPAIQWFTATPLLFPFKNLVIWGLGLPLGILSLVAVFYSVFLFVKSLWKIISLKKIYDYTKHLTIEQFSHFLILFWILLLFFYQGIQPTPSMRYFLPLYPFVSIVTANFLYNLFSFISEKVSKQIAILLNCSIVVLILIYPLSFLAIYSRPHSRVTASEWIYKNIPQGATLSCDLWDDCLPLPLNGNKSPYNYKIVTMEPFAPDTPDKITLFKNNLKDIDYLVLSSNRAWGSLTKVPEKFPFMSKFYTELFAGKLGFEKVSEITSYPTIPILGIQIPDQSSEEAFTVYDHPKILIFKNTLKSFRE